MYKFDIYDLVIINIPINRRGAKNSIHGETGTIIRRGFFREKRGKGIKYVVRLSSKKKNIHIKDSTLLLRVSQKTHPELYI